MDLRGTRGTGQLRRKMKEDEIRIGIAGARSLSSKAGEGRGSRQIGRILNHEIFRQKKRNRRPAENHKAGANQYRAGRVVYRATNRAFDYLASGEESPTASLIRNGRGLKLTI